MERNDYIRLCQKASLKTDYAGVWWAVKWNESDLVRWRGGLYVPVDYKFNFQHGVPQHTAILHDTESYSVINARLAEVEGVKEP